MKKLLLLFLLIPLTFIGQSSILPGIMYKGVLFSAPDGFELNPQIENTFIDESGFQIGYGVFSFDIFNSLNDSEKLKALKKFIPEIKFGDSEISLKIESETDGVIGYTSSIDLNEVFVFAIHFFVSDKLIQIQSIDKDSKTAVSNILNFGVNNKLLKEYIKPDSKNSKDVKSTKLLDSDLFFTTKSKYKLPSPIQAPIETEKTAKEYFDEGLAMAQKKDYERAIIKFNRAIELNSNYTGAYYSRGTLKNYLNDYIGAIGDFSRAIELNNNYPAAYQNMAFSKRKLKDFTGAIAAHTKAIEIDPNFVNAYIARGLSKIDLKDHEGAIADYNKAILIDTDNAISYNNRAIAKRKLEDYIGAIADYTKAIELDPEYESAYLNRGLSREKLGDLKGACKDWTKASSLGNQGSAEFVKAYCN